MGFLLEQAKEKQLDFKSVLIITKIHKYLIENRQNNYRRVFLEKRTALVLSVIEKSITDEIAKQNLDDVVYIASVFIPYLNQPDFLFGIINRHSAHLKMNQKTRSIYQKFVQCLLDKLDNKYTYFWLSQVQEVEFNDKLTPDVRKLLLSLIFKFRECKLLSFFLLSIQIGAHPGLLQSLYTNPAELQQLVEHSCSQIYKLIKDQANKVDLNNLQLFAKFLYENRDLIPKKNKMQILDALSKNLMK